MERLLTVKEVSQIIRRPEMSIYKLTRDGELRVVKVGLRGIRIQEGELQRWLDAKTTARGRNDERGR